MEDKKYIHKSKLLEGNVHPRISNSLYFHLSVDYEWAQMQSCRSFSSNNLILSFPVLNPEKQISTEVPT